MRGTRVVTLCNAGGLIGSIDLEQLVIAVARCTLDAIATCIEEFQLIAVVLVQVQNLGEELASFGVGAALLHHVASRVVEHPGGLLGLLVGVDFQLNTMIGLNGIGEMEGADIALDIVTVDVGQPHLHLIVALGI